jgi:hypothetical protein
LLFQRRLGADLTTSESIAMSKSITIRSATQSDIHWIVGLLQDGANGGHFGGRVREQAQSVIEATLSNGGFAMLKLRDGASMQAFIPARLDV